MISYKKLTVCRSWYLQYKKFPQIYDISYLSLSHMKNVSCLLADWTNLAWNFIMSRSMLLINWSINTHN